MTYPRVVSRNSLLGGHDAPLLGGTPERDRTLSMIRDDLRRLEHDQRDSRHLEMYADKAGITPQQAKTILDSFFEGSL